MLIRTPPARGWEPSADVAELSDWLRVLADPRRLTLVQLLAQRERCVCEFGDLLGWPQNLISHHLGALRRAGLTRARRDAQWVYYSLRPETWQRLDVLLREMIGTGELPAEARFGATPSRRCCD